MLTAFGAAAVTFMMLMYALERRGRGFIFAFGCGCLLSSAYGFLAGTWPFGVVEAIWAGVAFNRFRQTPERVTPNHNKRLVHRLVQIVNERDFDSIEEVASGQIATEARRWVGPFSDSFPDFQMEVVDVIAEDEKVVGYFKCSGTHQGEWRGHPATGQRFEGVDEVYIFNVEDGKLASAVAVVEDNLARLRQLGLLG